MTKEILYKNVPFFCPKNIPFSLCKSVLESWEKILRARLVWPSDWPSEIINQGSVLSHNKWNGTRKLVVSGPSFSYAEPRFPSWKGCSNKFKRIFSWNSRHQSWRRFPNSVKKINRRTSCRKDAQSRYLQKNIWIKTDFFTYKYRGSFSKLTPQICCPRGLRSYRAPLKICAG